MSGIFAEHQAEYEEAGLPTFPVKFVAQGDNKWSKKPAVKYWPQVGINGSREYARKFPDADAFGFPLRKVTILDVDCADERVLEDALERHGDTPLIVKTASGGWHPYYKRNGERRLIKPWDGLPIDLLGGTGYAVAAPSKSPKGQYRIIRGGLADIPNLPVMRGLEPHLYVVGGTDHADHRPPAPEYGGIIPDGKRGSEFWKVLWRHAHHVDGLDALLDYARSANQNLCVPPMEDIRVVQDATRAWEQTERGKNWWGAGARAAVLHTVVDELESQPLALTMLVVLQRNHGLRQTFAISQAMAESRGWPRRDFRAARDALVASGHIRCINPGRRGSHAPAIYGWPGKKG